MALMNVCQSATYKRQGYRSRCARQRDTLGPGQIDRLVPAEWHTTAAQEELGHSELMTGDTLKRFHRIDATDNKQELLKGS